MESLGTFSQPMGAIFRMSTGTAVAALVRNLLEALPPSVFTEPWYSNTTGEVKIYLQDPVLIHEALVKNADVLGKGEQVRRGSGPACGPRAFSQKGDFKAVAGIISQRRPPKL